MQSDAAAVGLRLALAVSDFWFSQGSHREAVYWVQRLLALPTAVQEKKLRLVALIAIGFTQRWLLGSYTEARQLQQEALLLAQELGDADRIEKTLNNLGVLASQSQLSGYDKVAYVELTAALQSRMNEPPLQTAWLTGRTLALEQTVELTQQWQAQISVVTVK